jgi:hypothetical protein
MSGIHNIGPLMVGLGVLALVALLALWRTGQKRAQHAAVRVREVTRMGSTFVRTLVIAAVIVGVQWAVIAQSDDRLALGVALSVPALLGGITVARLSISTEVMEMKKEVCR